MTADYNWDRDADDRQKEVYKHFNPDSRLGTQQSVEHLIAWTTFFRRNLHRFATDYLGIKLYLYQVIWLYLMGISRFFVVIASRASAKSWMIALYACCKCILYPHYQIVLASSTRGQSKLLVSEKIQKDLCGRSPVLNREIDKIIVNQNATIVTFAGNLSSITVVTADDRSRGHRSNCIVREEFRSLKKSLDDSVLSQFQILRQPVYMNDPYYADKKELREEPTDIYISSSWYDNGSDDTWMWSIVDHTFEDMLADKSACLLAFDESVALRHGIKSQTYFQNEKKKQDPLTYRIEVRNERIRENRSAFFTRKLLSDCQTLRQPFFPRSVADYRARVKNRFAIPKQPGEIRVIGCDLAFVEGSNNDNSVYTLMRLLPESTSHTADSGKDIVYDRIYRRLVPYIEPKQGGEIKTQAIRIRQLYDDFGADYIVLDARNAGRNAH